MAFFCMNGWLCHKHAFVSHLLRIVFIYPPQHPSICRNIAFSKNQRTMVRTPRGFGAPQGTATRSMTFSFWVPLWNSPHMKSSLPCTSGWGICHLRKTNLRFHWINGSVGPFVAFENAMWKVLPQVLYGSTAYLGEVISHEQNNSSAPTPFC